MWVVVGERGRGGRRADVQDEDLQPASVGEPDRFVERVRGFACPLERDEDAIDLLGWPRARWDDGDRLWEARDYL